MQARAEQTRTRLLNVATQLFSERGFDGVSTRDIANAAEATLPSIAHHFGSKQGLYEAVLASIAEVMEAQLPQEGRSILMAIEEGNISKSQALKLLQSLLTLHTTVTLDSRLDWTALIVREQLFPTPGLTRLEGIMENGLFAPMTRLIGILRDLPANDEAVKLQALSLVGRTLGYRAVRTSTLRFLGWDDFSPQRISAVTKALEEEVQAIFRLD